MIGTSLHHYRIEERIGAGGMGEVYRATDTSLGRNVAIKVLNKAVLDDPQRLARFEREARLLAALNHPNIAAVHGFAEDSGTWYLAMEFVPGRSPAGPLSLDETLQICRQVAEGLEAAHEKGIIHRDLKPANIRVTPDGKVKLLDFGLAKALEEPTSQDASDSPTWALSETRGAILGTAAYMSPEQARGKTLDRRTDIWSFGCVLYQLLAGRPPFAADSPSDVLVGILSGEPGWADLPANVPSRVLQLLRRCLQKDLAKRLRDAGDARLEIEEALTELNTAPAKSSSTLHSAPLQPRGRSYSWAVFAGLVIASFAGAWWLRGNLAAPDRGTQNVRVSRLTDFVGLELYPAISPDGKSVAFVADVDGSLQIWVRLLAGGTPLQITHDAAKHLYPRWSRDSASILYYTPSDEPQQPGTLWQISALGGSPRRVVSSITNGDISYDNKRICFLRFEQGAMEVATADRNGGDARKVAPVVAAFNYSNLRWSPNGKWIAFQRGGSLNYDIFAVSVATGELVAVTQDRVLQGGFSWLPDSSGVVYSSARGSTVLYLPVYNLWTMQFLGTPRQLTFGEQSSYLSPDLDSRGQVVASRNDIRFDIWRFPVSGDAAENVRRGVRITHQTGQLHTPSLGPGDKELVYLSDSGGHGNLWVTSVDGKQNRQITSEQDPDLALGVPVWSPSGQHIAYVVRKAGNWNVDIHLIHPDGSSPRRFAPESGWAAWSADGRWLYFSERSTEGVWTLKKTPVEGGGTETVRKENVFSPNVDRDGTLYYVNTLQSANGVSDIEIRKAKPEGGASQLVARIAGERIPEWQLIHPVLSPDGKWLAVPLNDGFTTNIWAVPSAGGPLRQLTQFAPSRTFIARRVSWSSDGRWVYAAVGHGDADVIYFEGFHLQ